jgi:hypothetical protein
MKNCLLLFLLVATAIGCGKSSSPVEPDRSAESATPAPEGQADALEQGHGADDSVVSPVLETVADTAQATVVEVREQAEAVVEEAQELVAEAQDQVQAVVVDARNQVEAVVAEVQQQAKTVITELPPEIEQISTQAQHQLQAIAGKSLDLRALQPQVNLDTLGPTNRAANEETMPVTAADTNQPATLRTNAASGLETNVVTAVTNVVQETRKALDRLFAPRRGGAR